ncbi:MAG: multicomponent Na+:H+ antiporter subunit G [Lentimonas sp.]|jgi:multicomponent Na+:H+ antiporter subunit G
MIAFISSALLLLGSLFALVAAIGIVRMPDIYCRMHAATKAGAFGVSLILLALCVAIPTLRVCIQSILIIAFFYLTAPVAAHLIGRVGIIQKLPLWKP